MNYDPNLTLCGRMAWQTVELTFQVWEYTATHTTKVGGNCTGLSVIETAVENILESLGGDDGSLFLTDAHGNRNECELWEHSLADMLVSARIIAIEPEVDSDSSNVEVSDRP